ncbi:MAG: hypothetical protein LBQ66_14785 [Planctomycetaceae bacterium]|nr:hypothetical protein [Planctomycetaceae bacterium]
MRNSEFGIKDTAPNSAFRIPHSELRIPHSAFRITHRGGRDARVPVRAASRLLSGKCHSFHFIIFVIYFAKV